MAFWPSYFHRSHADDSLARTLCRIKQDVVEMQVVLGNETTENSLVHDVTSLKSNVALDKERDRQMAVIQMDSVKAASDQLKEDVETVRKMKGPQGERGDRGPHGERGSVGLKGECGDRGPHGERGDRGLKGERGSVGPQGERGYRGDRGPQGEGGLKGETGVRGERGLLRSVSSSPLHCSAPKQFPVD